MSPERSLTTRRRSAGVDSPHGVDGGVSRRQVLRRAVAAGALLGTAGCTGDGARENTQPATDEDPRSGDEDPGSGDGPTPVVEYDESTTEPACPPEPPEFGTTTPDSVGSPTPDSVRTGNAGGADGDIEVVAVSVSDFIQYALSGTHPVVTREPGTQYVTVRCDTSLSSATVRESLTLRLDGQSIPLAGRQPYSWQHDTVDLAFSVPKTGTYAGGTVLIDGSGVRSLSGATVERLNDPPAFAVSSPSVSPDSIRPDEEATAEVRFTLENTCRGRGTFGASISGAVSGYSLVTATLDPGERREITADARIVGRSNGSGSRVTLRWGTNSLAATIPVVGTPDR